ncbi:MAG: PilZ domain-containing protein [Deltaproteobacteria bacterium]|nr:PilZ domain-containing protein [Deltaproteobacteria bacterium]
MSADRRKHERKPVEPLYCSVESLSGGWCCGGKIKDMSEGGMGLEMLKVPTLRDEMVLYMIEEGGTQSVKKAFVAWARQKAPPGVSTLVGLQFAQSCC